MTSITLASLAQLGPPKSLVLWTPINFISSGVFPPHLVGIAAWVYVTFSCEFNFDQFPFDTHSCTLFISPSMDSSQTVTFNSIELFDLLSESTTSIKKSKNRLAFDYELIPVNPDKIYQLNETYSRAALLFKLRRNDYDRKRIYVQFLIPTGTFALISHIAFFIDSSQVPGRLGFLVMLYLISVNTYNSLDAPIKRGFSNIDLWFIGIELTIIFGILEFGSILCFKKITDYKEKRFDNSKLQHVDFCAFVFSSISFGIFVAYYASINSFK